MSVRRAALATLLPTFLLLAHPLGAASGPASAALRAPVGLPLGGAPAPQPHEDPRMKVMSALKAELARSQRLTTEGFQPPYYVGYLLRDVTRLSVNGKYGAIYESSSDHSRNLYAQVRVGDYSFDSSGEGGFEFNFDPDADYGSLFNYVRAPVDDDPDALRDAVWLLTDYKYKEALQSYLKKKGKAVYSVAKKEKVDDFTHEQPSQYEGPSIDAKMDPAFWEKIVRDEGAYIKQFPEVFDSGVTANVVKTTHYQVTSEGTSIVFDDVVYTVSVDAMTRADDGQLLTGNRTFYARTFEDLPSPDRIHAEVKRMVAEVLEERTAEEMPPYSGPAVLAPRVTGVFFHEAVGHRLEAKRERSDSEGQTFKDKVGEPVLPTFISVYDDPSLAKSGDTDLNGWYPYDDEGVKATDVPLIVDGVLKNFLMGRSPIEGGFNHSNGHGRNSSYEDPMGRMANLIVKGSKPVSDEKLKDMLLAEVRRQGKPFGVWIEDVTGGETNTQRGDVQAFHGVPTRMYKVDAKTGKMTLVRGAEFIGTPLTVIGKIMATGEGSDVFNGYCGAESGFVPVSTVAPAVLLKELELQRSSSEKRKPPILPPPAFDPALLGVPPRGGLPGPASSPTPTK